MTNTFHDELAHIQQVDGYAHTDHLNTERTAAVSDNYWWQPMTTHVDSEEPNQPGQDQ